MNSYVAPRKNKKPSCGKKQEQNLKFHLDESYGRHLFRPDWEPFPDKTIIHFGYGGTDIVGRDGSAWNLDHEEKNKWNGTSPT